MAKLVSDNRLPPFGSMTMLLIRGLALLLLIATASCTKHEVAPSSPKGVTTPSAVLAPSVTQRMMDIQQDSEIDLVMREVRQGDIKPAEAQQQLMQIIHTAPPVLANEARFRAVELQLEWDAPYADASAEVLLTQWSDNALIPYLHDWLSEWLLRHDDAVGALHHLTAVIDGETTVPDLRHKALQSAMALMVKADDKTAVTWLLQRMASLQTEDLLAAARMAAMRSPLSLISDLRQQGAINQPLFAPYYQEAARIALMRGDRDTLAVIAQWSASDIADTTENTMIHRWQSGSSRKVNIGVLLPLSGEYARFGEQALHGVRMAVSKLHYGEKISLVIADSGGNKETTIASYQRLITAGCVAVIGPVLADDVRALAPYLHPDVPVIALTNQRAVAALASPLFVHSAGPQVQAAFLAELVQKRLHDSLPDLNQRQPAEVAVIASQSKGSQSSAALFQQLLEVDGLIKVHHLTIKNAADERLQLIALRRDSDDGLLLDELDEDMALFIAESHLQPVLPSSLAAIYLPLSGKDVAQLAGQLAYVGLNQVSILGDSRWLDGHLLDDHGRYLATASIATVPSSQPSPQKRAFSYSAEEEYRQLWGDHAQSLLSDVAFDSLVVTATLTSSWGLQGQPLLRALHDPGGFPLATGNVVFDRQGIGHKTFNLLSVLNGALVPKK